MIKGSTMNTRLRISAGLLGFMLISQQAPAQDAFAFFRGETFPPARTAPAAWLQELHKADGLLNANIAVATFLPNTRLAWHNHPGGQILLITDGVGYYQEKGQSKQILRVGDVVKCAPGVEHWHGAAVESAFTYVAVSPAQKGPTVWAQAVTDEEYNGAATDRRAAPVIRKSGSATLTELLKADGTFPFSIAKATFTPGKKLDWHKDPGGQILVVTDGSGYFQERGKPKQLLLKGDVVKSPAGAEHWHGAASEIGVTHIAITPVSESGTKWLEKVTDAEYGAPAQPGVKHVE
jgi:quercetin dioxygenase-like cupin family protein